MTSPHASQVSTSVEGLVSAVYFDSGAHVKAGDLLLELDAELEEAAYDQAAAQAAQAAAEVEDAKRRLKIAESLAKRDYGPKNEVEARQAEVDIDTATLDGFQAEQKRRNVILSALFVETEPEPNEWQRWQSMVVLTMAFLGAYIWSCQNIVRRLIAGDLAPIEYLKNSLRMVLALMM